METTRNKLVTYINQQIEINNWSHRELSRRSGISHTHIGKVLDNQAALTWDFCAIMARVFRLPIWEAFRMGGLVSSNIPDDIKKDDQLKILIEIFSKLPNEAQTDAIDYLKWLAYKNKI
jgi:transcriptional regulator with XRE-family HTH domain